MVTPHSRIKSYVLRQGRLTKAQQAALETQWQVFGIDYQPALLNWHNVFATRAPITLEIGFGNGESLLQQALANSEKNYLGIEVHRPGVGHLLHRITEQQLHNIRVIHHDAIDVLQNQIPDCSLACVQLFFPDPWQKRRHHKRRILRTDFIAAIHAKLDNGGEFHMATDWQDYAAHMQQEMDAAPGFKLTSHVRNERPVTKFEQRGIKLGHVVWDLVYTKKPT